MTVLRTRRLSGEPIMPGHGPLLAGLLTDPRVAATLGGVPSPDALAGMIARQAAHWTAHGFGYWLWRDRGSDTVVARGGLAHVVIAGRPEVEVGWAVDARRWGEGLASELGSAAVEHARDVLGLVEIVSVTLAANFPSRRVMDKLDFEREDEHVIYKGLEHLLYRRRFAGDRPAGELA